MKKLGVGATPTRDWLLSFQVGERRYVETTPATLEHDRRMVIGHRGARRPKDLQGREYSVHQYTAVGVGVGDIKYLLEVERRA